MGALLAVLHTPAVCGFPGTPNTAPAVGSGSQVGRAMAMSKSNQGIIACTGLGPADGSLSAVWEGSWFIFVKRALGFSVLICLVQTWLKLWL